MKKKVLVAVIVILCLAVVAGLIVLNSKKRSNEKLLVSPLVENSLGDSSSGKAGDTSKYLVWQDQAGFSFSYPKDWLFDTHEQDATNYANLGITKRGSEGGIKIVATDAKYKTIADWTKKDALVIGSSFMESSLSGVKAQKALLKSGEEVIGAIDEGVLYTLELIPDEAGYWQAEYNKLVSSFKLVYPTNYPAKANTSGSSGAGGNSGSDIVEEAEEIVE